MSGVGDEARPLAMDADGTHLSCWEVTELLRDDSSAQRSHRAAERLINLAAGLAPGSHLSLVLAGDGTGGVSVSLHTDATRGDFESLLDWVTEGVCRWAPRTCQPAELEAIPDLNEVVEVVPAFETAHPEVSLDVPEAGPTLDARAQGTTASTPPASQPRALWPVGFSDDGMELLRALTTVHAQVRVHLAPASPLEVQMIAAQTRSSVQSTDPVMYSRYMGSPIRVRTFIGESGDHLSPRLRAALMRLGIGVVLQPRSLADNETRRAWDGDEWTLAGAVEPAGTALCYVRFPACGPEATLCGIPTVEAEIPPIPLSVDEHLPTGGLRLGTAVNSRGGSVEVLIGGDDLVLHTQVLGASGTGKSTLLAAIVQEAALAGMGVTVLESHGPLVDRIMAELPDSAVDRTIVVRSGDSANPVPVNVLTGTNGPLLAEVMLEVFRELLDPANQGFLGPRFERAYGVSVEAMHLLLGKRATLSAIPLILRERAQVMRLAQAVERSAPALADALRGEFGRLQESDFAEISAWINAKFQRLVGSSGMRAILGTGADAVDVTKLIDDRGILLVDLAAPTLGPTSAQLLGEMWLAKHWGALASRADVTQPHLLIVDEAHLFASGLLPRLLAEARKFGVGVILAHQHLEQLGVHLRQAALATTNNVIIFRSGPVEAVAATTRLGSWAGGSLTRLPRFQAAATLSQGVKQTDPFSLSVDHNNRVGIVADADARIALIERATARTYVDPYRDMPVVTAAEVDQAITSLSSSAGGVRAPAEPPQPSSSDLLKQWRDARLREAQTKDDSDDT